MEIPVFDIKGSDASAAAPVKQADSTGKITVANFTKIFDGCVNECSNAEQGSGAIAPVIAGSADSTASAKPVIFNTTAAKAAVAGEGFTKSSVISDKGVATPSVEPLTVSAEPLTFNTVAVKAAVAGEGVMKNAVISDNGVVAPSVEPLTFSAASEKAVVASEDKTEDLFNGAKSAVKALSKDFTASIHEAAAESGSSTKASAVAEQTLASAPFKPSASKTDKAEKPAKPEGTRALKSNEKQSAESVNPVLASLDKPSVKTENGETENSYSVKEFKSGKEGDKKSVSNETEKSDEKVPSPALFSQQSQPVPVAVVQEVNKQASVVMPASQGSINSNAGAEKASEKPIVASEDKASKASAAALTGAGEQSSGKADSLPASEDVLAASVKTADIKSAKTLSDTDQEEPYTDKMMPKGLNARGDDHGDKNILKADANGPVTKKTQTMPTGLPSGNFFHSDTTESAESADGKVAAIKSGQEHLSPAFAERLRADNPGSNASNGPAGAEKQVKPLLVNAVSGSECFEGSDERKGKGGEGKKDGLLKIENATGTMHGGPEVRNARFTPDATPAKQTETVRAEAVFEKLDSGVKWSLGKGGKEVSLSLNPEHLGRLHIKLNIEESTVKARIVVESDAAKAILETDSGKLKEVFARQGLTLDKYTIELSPNSNLSGGGSFTENGARENASGRPSSWGRAGGRDEETAGTKAYGHTENIRRSTGGVDLFA